MKKIIIALFLVFSSLSHAATYYIDPLGNDATGDGSIGSPWKTLSHACGQVVTAGDLIHVNSGAYFEITQSALAVGVSIEGEGVTSNIISNISKQYAFTIALKSASEGTNGNQHISNLKLDGNNLTSWGAIGIYARSNVKIYNCTFTNFNSQGVLFNGGTGYLEAQPNIYATGNEFHDNIMTNCSRYFYGTDLGLGCLNISGQEGLLVYNNDINQTQRALGYNGYPITFYGDGFNKAIKIYNNKLVSSPIVAGAIGTNYMFAIELWSSGEGSEIYGNDIQGTLDLVNSNKGSAEFSWKIYNNYIGWDNLMPDTKWGEIGIHFEGESSDIYIYNNHFKNLATGIYFTTLGVQDAKNIYIYYNLFENLGTTGTTYSGLGRGIDVDPDVSNVPFDNWNIWNNVFTGHESAIDTRFGIGVPQGITTNISIRNNIVQGFDYAAVWVGDSPNEVDVISIENNDFYQNGYNDAPRGTAILTNYTLNNNIKSDPLFVSSSNFQLQEGSPCIQKGINVGLTTDFQGNSSKNPPSIGAYEYDSNPPIPAPPVYLGSVIEHSTPRILEMNYDLILADIIPATTAFNVQVNGVNRNVSSVAISSKKVLLTLTTAVVFGDNITVSYNKPGSNWLQTTTGGEAANITDQSVINNCLDPTVPNDPPILVIINESTIYSGFVGEIDASGSYDLNNDVLTYEWTVPNNVPISSTNSSKIQFLSPVVSTEQVFEFILKVNDGRAIQSSSIPISILPYKPELAVARIASIEASDYQVPDNPDNVTDGNLATKWSANGDNQWLLLKFAVPFKINHLELAFLQGQRYESYFDIYASKDNLIWEPILTEAASCNFSGDRQIFDFPAIKTNIEYSYIRLVGHGNSLNTWNNISEFKIFGFLQQNSGSGDTEKRNIIIYPNPAQKFFNISIEELTLEPNVIRLIDLFGKIVFEDSLEPGIKNIQIPNYLNTGIYIVELRSGSSILDAQKLMINK